MWRQWLERRTDGRWWGTVVDGRVWTSLPQSGRSSASSNGNGVSDLCINKATPESVSLTDDRSKIWTEGRPVGLEAGRPWCPGLVGSRCDRGRRPWARLQSGGFPPACHQHFYSVQPLSLQSGAPASPPLDCQITEKERREKKIANTTVPTWMNQN